MQTNFNLATKDQLKHCWAFAVDKTRGVRRAYSGSRSDCIITACSQQAKQLGIKAGMRYDEAKARVPELRILICNSR